MATKYDGLAAYLRQQQGATLTMTFAAVAATLRPPHLPRSASIHRAWWGNHRSATANTQARNGWLAAGWEVDSVNLAGQTVTFRR